MGKRLVYISFLALISCSNASKNNEQKNELAAKTSAKNTEVSNERDTEFSASHILIMHNESKMKRPENTRTRREAADLSEKIYKELENGEGFKLLAAAYSDDQTTKGGNGFLGIFSPKKMPPEFIKALKTLKVGEILLIDR